MAIPSMVLMSRHPRLRSRVSAPTDAQTDCSQLQGLTDYLRTSLPLHTSTLINGRNLLLGQAQRHHLRRLGATARPSATSPPERVDAIALFRFIGPGRNLLLCDRHATDGLIHAINVLRKYCGIKTRLGTPLARRNRNTSGGTKRQPCPRSSATAARARALSSSRSWPYAVTCPSLRPGRTSLPYRCTFTSGNCAITSG